MQTKSLILVVEDEPIISSFISTILADHGYRTISCTTARECLTISASHCPDLIIMDLGLPDMDGLELITRIRSWNFVPVIIISARDSEADKVLALDSGADDYLTKPFGGYELLARIRAALRHCVPADTHDQYRFEDLTIDFKGRLVRLSDIFIHLTQIEFKIVALLARHSGMVLTYDHIIKEIWGPYAGNNNKILRVNMVNIRRKIEENPGKPKYIFTEIGIGYRMAEGRMAYVSGAALL